MTSDEPSIGLLPLRIHFRTKPEVTLVRPCLGLTLYLADPAAWADRLASELFERFLQAVDPARLKWFQTSGSTQWRTVADLSDLRGHLSTQSLMGRVRHLWRFSCADDPGAPGVGFTYREVDPRRVGPSAYLQIFLPFNAPPDELLALAVEIGQGYPIRSGVGGYCFTWNQAYPRNSFHALYRLCRRFVAFDVQQPDSMAWHAERCLPGSGWLTLIGAMPGVDADALRSRGWAHEVAVLPLREALLVKAGRAPVLGDLNQAEVAGAHAEVAQVLFPYLVQDQTVLPGAFEEEDRTRAWRERFTFPEGW